jgi:hypothetical protein
MQLPRCRHDCPTPSLRSIIDGIVNADHGRGKWITGDL